jgi:phytanoyl-CoA hydroxylase
MSALNNFKDTLKKYYWMQKFKATNPVLEFDNDTLPWIDAPNPDIKGMLKRFDIPKNLGYDMEEKLQFWNKNGFVIFEQVIPHDWLDTLWADVEEVIHNNHKYNTTAVVYQFNDKRDTPVKDIPSEKLNKLGARLNDFHHLSVAGKKVATHPAIAEFLKVMLNQQVVLYSNLAFKYGSQQHTHQDYPWTRSGIMSHLAGTWVPCEDLVEGCGPLYYYPGSHRIPKFNFGTGIHFDGGRSYYGPEDYAKHLDKVCTEMGFKKEEFLPKKGDALIWHSALAHGGSYLTKEVTRKSFVTHFTTEQSYPKHKAEQGPHSITELYNGIKVYHNATNLAEENILKAGERF